MHVCWWWCFWLPLPLFLFWVFLLMLLDRNRTIDCAALQDNHDYVPSNSSKSSLPGLSNRVIPNKRSTRRYITQRTPLCPCTSTTSRQMPQGVSPPLASLSLSARLPQSLVPRIGLIDSHSVLACRARGCSNRKYGNIDGQPILSIRKKPSFTRSFTRMLPLLLCL